MRSKTAKKLESKVSPEIKERINKWAEKQVNLGDEVHHKLSTLEVVALILGVITIYLLCTLVFSITRV